MFRNIIRSMSLLANRVQAPVDPMFSITANFRKDTSPNKVNLGVGAYQTDDSKPWVLPVVRKVENELAKDESLDKEYLPISGDVEYVKECLKMLYGKQNPLLNGKIDGVQTLSGTGACRVGLEYLKKFQNAKTIYISNPTWAIHKTLATQAGYENVQTYSYFNKETNSLDFENMYKDLMSAEKRSIILLHGAGHNPTGVDPTNEQWDKLSELFKNKEVFPFFDCAYMGFCSGNIDRDAYPIRKFAESGIEFFAGVSFAKILGLYNERVGFLSYVLNDNDCETIKGQIKIIIRNSYSNPPSHGARIVKAILCNDDNFNQWMKELNVMTSRIKLMRETLFNCLQSLKTPGDWSHIVSQRGLFSFTGLTEKQVELLTSKHHIYLTKNGRINICGLTTKNIDYVARAIDDVIRETISE